MKRTNDSGTQFYYCTDRIFEDSGNWYFLTRECTVIGPFGDELEARVQIEAYIRRMNPGLKPADGELSLAPLASMSVVGVAARHTH